VQRADIQALRALAVAAVFAFHLWPGVVRGGFVGVDVFFVISGFLIAGHLIREAESTGGIRLAEFWTRRARRLLPGALVTLVVVSIGVAIWVPANLWPQFQREALASTLYVQNWVLAGDSLDYFASVNSPSPVQHFWTLSAEEQFYIFTPLLLLGALWLGRRWRTPRRPVLFTGIAILTAASLAYSVWSTAAGPAAYFETTARAWEFGAGALLVFAPPARHRWLGTAAAGAGIAGIVLSATLLSGDMPFPGAIAAIPVLATGAAIWGGPALGPMGRRLVGLRPVAFLGDTSYAIYLWHWPLIVIAPFALGHDLSLKDKLFLVALTLLVAATSTRYVENPIRYARVLNGPRGIRWTAAMGAVAMAVVASLAAGGLLVSTAQQTAAAREAHDVQVAHGDCLGAMASPNDSACARVLPSGLIVPDTNATGPSGNLPECWAGVAEAELRVCSFGPADATVHLIAIGDSHSNALIPAYWAIAQRMHWQIWIAGHNGCYWTAAVQVKPAPAMVTGCEAWKHNLADWLDSHPPLDAIIVTNARDGAPVQAPVSSVFQVTVRGLVDAWATQTRRGVRIIAIRDNPDMAFDVVSCVVRHAGDPNAACSRPSSTAVGTRDPLVAAAQATPLARLVDLTDVYCPGGICLPVIGHVMVYVNRDHLTGTFAASLAAVLGDRLAAALAS
jgi:peptidoglycan/LPS O-acetylase OafA/YrhL